MGRPRESVTHGGWDPCYAGGEVPAIRRRGRLGAGRVTGGGTDSLVVEVAEPATVDVGALGPVRFAPGWYDYAGSARGPGGFARLDRHREVAAGVREVRHWHVDYLLGHETATVEADFRTAGVDGECALAAATGGQPVPAFGCSDCACDSHLHRHAGRDAALTAVAGAHASLAARAR